MTLKPAAGSAVVVQNERPLAISNFEIRQLPAVWGRHGHCHVVLLR
jgi:hypothetical protein